MQAFPVMAVIITYIMQYECCTVLMHEGHVRTVNRSPQTVSVLAFNSMFWTSSSEMKNIISE